MAVEPGVDEDGPVRVPVRVDEARRDHPAVDIEDALDLRRIDRAEVPDGQDPVAEHADIGSPRRRARAVDDGPAAEQQVEAGHVRMMTPRPTRRVAGGRSARSGSPAGTGPSCYTPPSVGL